MKNIIRIFGIVMIISIIASVVSGMDINPKGLTLTLDGDWTVSEETVLTTTYYDKNQKIYLSNTRFYIPMKTLMKDNNTFYEVQMEIEYSHNSNVASNDLKRFEMFKNNVRYMLSLVEIDTERKQYREVKSILLNDKKEIVFSRDYEEEQFPWHDTTGIYDLDSL